MNIIFCVFLTMFTTSNVLAFSLEGTWQEDKEKTLSWNETNRVVNGGYLENMEKILGNVFVTYSQGKHCFYSRPYQISNGEKISEITAYPVQIASYDVLAKNEYGFVLKSTYKDELENIVMYIFEGEDSMYGVSLTTEDFGQPGSRIYFKKVQPVQWGSVCNI